MIKRDVQARYRGSMLGMLWTFVTPLLMLAVYTFFFTTIFKARWQPITGAQQDITSFALILFSGLILHAFFAECLNRATTVIVSQANFVKKIMFPLHVLPLVTIGGGAFHFLISFLVLLLGYTFLYGMPHITLLMLPVVMMPLMLMIMGMSWFIASLGVYVRDLSHLVGLLMMVLMFLSPIFYPLSILPDTLRPWFYLNPLTIPIEAFRAVALYGEMPNCFLLMSYFTASVVCAVIGYYWFQKTKKGFADIL
jgi:lipopolysaccharide transport system permease protein